MIHKSNISQSCVYYLKNIILNISASLYLKNYLRPFYKISFNEIFSLADCLVHVYSETASIIVSVNIELIFFLWLLANWAICNQIIVLLYNTHNLDIIWKPYAWWLYVNLKIVFGVLFFQLIFHFNRLTIIVPYFHN